MRVTFVEQRGSVFAGVLQDTCLAAFGRRRARRTAIASANGRILDVAKVPSPRGTDPWVLPRRADDAHVAAAAATMPLSLESAGWKVSTGPLVWNRRRDDLGAEQTERSAPVVWAADLDGGQLHEDASRASLRWLALRDGDAAVILLEEPAILVQRTTAPEQPRRVVGVELTLEDLRARGGAVVARTTSTCCGRRRSRPRCRSTLTAVLATKTIDRLTRCVSGSVALSAYELESLPLPAAPVLATWENLRGEDLERAVAAAYRPSAR